RSAPTRFGLVCRSGRDRCFHRNGQMELENNSGRNCERTVRFGLQISFLNRLALRLLNQNREYEINPFHIALRSTEKTRSSSFSSPSALPLNQRKKALVRFRQRNELTGAPRFTGPF